MTDTSFDQPALNYDQLKQALTTAGSREELNSLIVNAPFSQKVETTLMFLGIIVLLKADKATGVIDRVALSNTELAKNTTDVSVVPFQDIKVPLDDPENILAKAVRTSKPQDTTDWKFLFEPALSAEQARINQASGGIAYSAVYPFDDGGTPGALIYSYFQYMHNIGNPQHEFMRQYTDLVATTINGLNREA